MSGISPGGGGSGGGITPNPPIVASTWATYPAVDNVNMNNKNINNTDTINCQFLNSGGHDISGNLQVNGTLTVDDITTLNNELDLTNHNITNVATLTATGLNVNGTSTLTGNLFVEGSNQILVKDQGTIDLILSEPTLSKAYGINGNVSSTNDYGLVLTGRSVGGVDESLLTLNSSQSSQSGTMDCHNNRIVNVSNPVSSQDVATKAYADSLVSATPNLTQVLTAGGDGGDLPITNIQSLNVNSSGITTTGSINSLGASIGLSGINNTGGYNGPDVRVDDVVARGTNLDITASSTLGITSGTITMSSNTYIYQTEPAGLGTVDTRTLSISNMLDTATDSSTSTAMSRYRMAGAPVGSAGASNRNWATFQVYSGAAQIAKMRIALDKGYFFSGIHPIRIGSITSQIDKSFYGLILSSEGNYINKPEITEAHLYCNFTTKEKDKNVYGILSSYDFVVNNPDSKEEENIYSLFIPQKTPESNIAYSLSCGEGMMWVCNIGGNIEKGDYICSSKIPGLGMVQDDDLYHNYSIFKSAVDCDFTPHTSTYPAHIIDSEGERQWRDDADHSLGFKYEMKTYVNNVYNIIINPDNYVIDGILTFPYDFQKNKPELVGQTFKAMLIGGTVQN